MAMQCRMVPMTGGRLVYLVGASGVGKDSVLTGLRADLRPEDGVVVAHRYITRQVSADGENHVALSRQEFELRRAAGCFAMHWDSHGFEYGIGREIELWLAQGLTVLVNGSRAHGPEVRRQYPAAQLVEITASDAVIRQRLQARGRESAVEIEARLTRNRWLTGFPVDLKISNEGPVEETVAALSSILTAQSRDGHTANELR
jgi:ribose 1,5-bisphosphokinase